MGMENYSYLKTGNKNTNLKGGAVNKTLQLIKM
jgi:hypothetical protein